VLYPIFLLTGLTSGRTYLAGIDSYPLALAAMLSPFTRVETFDEGAFNILASSRYYSRTPLLGNKPTSRIARWLFPQGCAFWFRERTTLHYTIFGKQPNIVDIDKIRSISLDWSKLLNGEDLARLPANVSTVVLGTAHNNFPDPANSLAVARKIQKQSDLYILHPRETRWSDDLGVQRMHSPAEAILVHLSKLQKIQVYHFNSTVNYLLDDYANLSFINLVDPITRELISSR
jgi:hypothetical protein